MAAVLKSGSYMRSGEAVCRLSPSLQRRAIDTENLWSLNTTNPVSAKYNESNGHSIPEEYSLIFTLKADIPTVALRLAFNRLGEESRAPLRGDGEEYGVAGVQGGV